MRRLLRVLFGLAMALAVLTPLATAAPEPAEARLMPAKIDPGMIDTAAVLRHTPEGLRNGLDNRVSLIVRLSGPSLVTQLTDSRKNPTKYGGTALSTARLNKLRDDMLGRQALTAQAITKLGATVVDRYQSTLNGLLVRADRSQIAAIAQLPGVVKVGYAPILKPDLAAAVPFIGAKKVKDELKIDGKGSVIAVIDTGVDYTHKDFGGAGTVQAYNANDEDIVEPGSFPTEKVIGGVDLAGKFYSPACTGVNPSQLPPTWVCHGPKPDSDPLDNRDAAHGTHVSGIATGLGVNSILAPGVAPGAKLVMVKVFGAPQGGAPGSTDLANSGIEWITNHNLGIKNENPGILDPQTKINVINMSLGSGYGTDMDAANEAISAAVAAGVTVITSAGNSGNEPYVTGSPGAAQMAVSVASSYSDGYIGLEVLAEWTENGPKERREGGIEAVGDWTRTLEESGKIKGEVAFMGVGCNASGAPVQDIKEKIALIERGTCNVYEKVANAQTAGAIAALLYTTPDRAKGAIGCGAPSPCTTKLNPPEVMIDNAFGMAIRGMVEKNMKVIVTLDPDRIVVNKFDPSMVDTISDFSSRGPDRLTAGVKPQITAPGSDIVSAGAGTGDGYLSLSGTSMASPMIAGVAGLLWQRNLDQKLLLSAADIGALAMNYSMPTVAVGSQTTGPRAGVARQGAGRTQVYRSAVGNTLVRSEKGIAELGFSDLHFTDGTTSVTKKINIKNLSDKPKMYKLSNEFRFPSEDEGKGVTLSMKPAELTVAAKSSQDVEVTMDVDATRVRGWSLNALEAVAPIPARVNELSKLEVDGSIVVTEVDAGGTAVAGGDVVGVPYYSLPHRHACVDVDTSKALVLSAKDAEAPVVVTNTCGKSGTLEAYHYVGTDVSESKEPKAAMPPKVDIQNVGLRYGDVNLNPQTPNTKERVIDFLVDLAGPMRSPFDLSTQIYIDSDNNMRYDHVLILAYAPAVYANPAAAPLRFLVLSAIMSEDNGGIDGTSLDGEFFVPYDIDSSTLVITTRAASVGLDAPSPDFKFGYGVWVADGTDDFPVTKVYPGYDYAPDGMLDVNTGNIAEYYVFDQQTAECIDLVDSNSQSLLVLNTILPLKTKERGELTAIRTCGTETKLEGETGFLFNYNGLTDQPVDPVTGNVWFAFQHTNPPEMAGSTVSDAEALGVKLAPVAPTRWFNYIPLTVQNYDGLVAAPTPEPTSAPVEPTSAPAEPTPGR